MILRGIEALPIGSAQCSFLKDEHWYAKSKSLPVLDFTSSLISIFNSKSTRYFSGTQYSQAICQSVTTARVFAEVGGLENLLT